MCVVEDLLILGYDFASTGNETQKFRDHALFCPFLGIIDPGKSSHVFSKCGVPLIPTRSVTSLKKLNI
jgi:hypothetical protein